jgi:hypothetical protein
VPFPQPPNSRVARHHTNSSFRQRGKGCVRAKPRSRMGGFATGMATPDDDDIEIKLFHVKHSLLSDAKARENLV